VTRATRACASKTAVVGRGDSLRFPVKLGHRCWRSAKKWKSFYSSTLLAVAASSLGWSGPVRVHLEIMQYPHGAGLRTMKRSTSDLLSNIISPRLSFSSGFAKQSCNHNGLTNVSQAVTILSPVMSGAVPRYHSWYHCQNWISPSLFPKSDIFGLYRAWAQDAAPGTLHLYISTLARYAASFKPQHLNPDLCWHWLTRVLQAIAKGKGNLIPLVVHATLLHWGTSRACGHWH
jgi:hypothetical protein